MLNIACCKGVRELRSLVVLAALVSVAVEEDLEDASGISSLRDIPDHAEPSAIVPATLGRRVVQDNSTFSGVSWPSTPPPSRSGSMTTSPTLGTNTSAPTVGPTRVPSLSPTARTNDDSFLTSKVIAFSLTVANLNSDRFQQDSLLFRRAIANLENTVTTAAGEYMGAAELHIDVRAGSTVFDFTISALTFVATRMILNNLNSGPKDELGSKLFQALMATPGVAQVSTGVLFIQQFILPHVLAASVPNTATKDEEPLYQSYTIWVCVLIASAAVLASVTILYLLRHIIKAKLLQFYTDKSDWLTIVDGDGEHTFCFRRNGCRLFMQIDNGYWIQVSALHWYAANCELYAASGEGGRFPASKLDLVRLFAEKAHTQMYIFGETKEEATKMKEDIGKTAKRVGTPEVREVPDCLFEDVQKENNKGRTNPLQNAASCKKRQQVRRSCTSSCDSTAFQDLAEKYRKPRRHSKDSQDKKKACSSSTSDKSKRVKRDLPRPETNSPPQACSSSTSDKFKRGTRDLPGPQTNPPPQATKDKAQSETSSGSEDTQDIPAVAEDHAYVETLRLVREELIFIGNIPTAKERKRALLDKLRRWHPDKNQDDIDLATAVFQYIQSHKEGLIEGYL